MPPRPAPPRRPPGLDADAIVTAAVRLARDEGLAALSMRRLAETLGATPMALYRHVSDREDLLLRMLDVVADTVPAPSDSDTPRERISAVMHGLHGAFSRDPWVVQVLATEGLSSPRILPAVEAVFGALAEVGLSSDQARETYALLLMFAYGETLMSHTVPAKDSGRSMPTDVDPDRFPHLAAIVADTGAAGRDHFAVNLERLLDGALGPR